MVLESRDEQLAVRFSPYVEELQQFFTGHSLRFGSPEDLFALSERISRPGAFPGELTSLMRAVIYREHESISQGDLLGLLTLAIGGPEIDLTDPQFRAPLRQILTFLGGVLRSMWRVMPSQPENIGPETEATPAYVAPSAMSLEVAATQAASPARVPESATQPIRRARVYEEVVQAAPSPPTVEKVSQAIPGTRVFERPTQATPPSHVIEEVQVRPEVPWYESYLSEPAAEAAPVSRQNLFTRVRGLWREPDVEAQTDDAAYPQYQPVGLFKAQYRPFWLVGLFGASLGLATGLMLRNRPPVPKPVVTTAAPQSFHPWFPPIPKPQAGEISQTANAPSPPLPLPTPNPVSSLPSRSSPHAPAVDLPARSASNMQGDRALEERFFSHPAASAQSLSQGSRSYNVSMTGQSHPPANVLAPSAVPSSRLRPEYAEGTPLAPPAASPSPFPPSGAFRAREIPRANVFLSASGAMAANLLSAPAPAYPVQASFSHVEGRVTVQAVVGLDGRVIATRVLSGPEPLREASLNAVRRWRYRPYLVNGKPFVVATNAILNFQLAP